MHGHPAGALGPAMSPLNDVPNCKFAFGGPRLAGDAAKVVRAWAFDDAACITPPPPGR